jgi:cob(I)alamin adenosyltransferase
MKIYTGTGDRGKTSLFSGERVPKDHRRIEAYGDLDELNSVLGALAAASAGLPDVQAELAGIQSELFHLGAWLATTPEAPAAAALPPIDPQHSGRLEAAIDRMEEGLQPLKGFILPGGHPSAAWAHVARTVCRRAERRVVGLAADGGPTAAQEQLQRAIVYLNRLSDYLFVLARHLNRLQGVDDARWNA